jgi:RNA polymerase-binding transcription factor DksA
MLRNSGNGFSEEFLKKQEDRIKARINKYNDPERIKRELETGDLSDYTKYKQKKLIPILNNVLHKICIGKYGYCEKCNQQIEQKRLELVPAAQHCMKCKFQG